MHNRQSCGQCSAIWAVGSEEWEWQICDACGWEAGDPIDLDEDDYDEDQDDEDF